MKQGDILLLYCDLLGDYILFRNYLEKFRRLSANAGRKIHWIGNASVRPLAEFLDGDLVDQTSWVGDYRPFTLTAKKLLKLPLVYLQGKRAMAEISVPGRVNELLCPSMAPWVTNVVSLVTWANKKMARDVEDGMLHHMQKMLYNKIYRPKSFYEFIFDQHRQFFELATGESFQDVKLSFPREKFVGLYTKTPLDKPFCVIFPDSAEVYKQWPPAHFAEVVRHIHREFGFHVYVCGHGSKRDLGDEIARLSGNANVTNLMGETSLMEAFDLIGQSKFVICNDSFALHASNAMGTPVMCLTQGLYRGRYLPYPEKYRLSKHVYMFTEPDARELGELRPATVIPHVAELLEPVVVPTARTSESIPHSTPVPVIEAVAARS